MISLLFNSQDLAVKGMSEEIKALCRSKDRCLKELLRKTFVGDYSVNLKLLLLGVRPSQGQFSLKSFSFLNSLKIDT